MLSSLQFISFVFVFFTLVILTKRWKKWRLDTSPFPVQWLLILEKNLPFYKKLPEVLRAQLHQHILLFLQDINFHGCNDFIITDEVKVTIAGEACLLLLNRTTNHYYQLHHILVYPSSFMTSREERSEAGTISHRKTHLLGESWSQGKVILSWEDVIMGAKNFTDGHNVVLHEFAHQLDQESGSANGAPLLGAHSSYQRWSTVLSKEFNKLKHDSNFGFENIIDQYGATNPAEFFAVVTETFFERPNQLYKKHPELFIEMKNFYAVDPRDWHNNKMN